MTVNKLDSRVAVVHRCFSERGDSILSVPLEKRPHFLGISYVGNIQETFL